MRAVVTGAAGFIGSTLTDRLLADGHHVLGIDCFTDYYEPARKRANLASARSHQTFELAEVDLCTRVDLLGLLQGVEVVFHQAAQAGVRSSWSDHFEDYTSHNILATQRILDAARQAGVRRFVHASSSSVYGPAERYPTTESDILNPSTPYGVTKLAAEQLCSVYASQWSLPTVALRYFTVYGPRQRPDMATHRMIDAALAGKPFPLHGDGHQRRDFTFVDDAVEACVRAATADVKPGTTLNIAGGTSVEVRELMSIIERLTDMSVTIEQLDPTPGDPRETGGSIELARSLLGWEPQCSLEAGLEAQIAWQRELAL